MQATLFITGTGTGTGKTVLTALLARFLRGKGVRTAAFKPACSGGRGDARALHAALGGTLTLDEINPWHFRAALAPALAAAREGKSISLAHVLTHIRATGKIFDAILIEGAGGLLSPLGEGFDSRDLITALRAAPVIVAPDKLGVVNHVLLTLEALPKNRRARAKVVLMSPARPDAATGQNARLLARFFPPERIFTLPWLGRKFSMADAVKKPAVKRTLRALAGF